ncbi:YraN family protein [Hydrogenimonas sp. SS33]|uniref:YraN family protein n=1 Tax=Hydrogenimonas leucolamina TaxID=2954236 RepID=UPI00336BC486
MSRAKGDAAEAQAVRFLMERGCRILERNAYSRFGEIDIIAEKGGALRFVEVKSGTGFDPIYNITPTKLGRIVKTAHAWLKKSGSDLPWQIDAVIVRDDGIEWLENITF